MFEIHTYSSTQAFLIHQGHKWRNFLRHNWNLWMPHDWKVIDLLGWQSQIRQLQAKKRQDHRYNAICPYHFIIKVLKLLFRRNTFFQMMLILHMFLDHSNRVAIHVPQSTATILSGSYNKLKIIQENVILE